MDDDEIRVPDGHDVALACPFCGGEIRPTYRIEPSNPYEATYAGEWKCFECMVANGRGFGCSGGLDEPAPRLRLVD